MLALQLLNIMRVEGIRCEGGADVAKQIKIHTLRPTGGGLPKHRALLRFGLLHQIGPM